VTDDAGPATAATAEALREATGKIAVAVAVTAVKDDVARLAPKVTEGELPTPAPPPCCHRGGACTKRPKSRRGRGGDGRQGRCRTEGDRRRTPDCGHLQPSGPGGRTLPRRAASVLRLRGSSMADTRDDARDKAPVGVGRLRAGSPA
jgi:hypothetical protein